MLKEVEKVIAYITRDNQGQRELLVFEHEDLPDAGIQVPAGTVDPNESIGQALFREVEEESGLIFVGICKYLGRFPWVREDRNELHHRNVFHLQFSNTLQERWQHTVYGTGEDSMMIFQFFWLTLKEAENILAVDQGKYLHLVM